MIRKIILCNNVKKIQNGKSPELQKWNFSIHEKQKAIKYYAKNGFVGFYDLLTPNDLEQIQHAVDAAVENGTLGYADDSIYPNQDVIYAHPILEQYVKDPRICNIVRELTGAPIELQHAKLNAKPLHSTSNGGIKWHQDYPFYPHTNFDLVACGIHLDDEDEGSGPLRYIPGSHKHGLESHCKDGVFAKEITCIEDLEKMPSELITCNAGQVMFHHSLIIHNSAPKVHDGQRRLIVFQYRAQDAIQLSGIVWRSTGYQVAPKEIQGLARFPDGTIVENRGLDGKLIDLFNRFKPAY